MGDSSTKPHCHSRQGWWAGTPLLVLAHGGGSNVGGRAPGRFMFTHQERDALCSARHAQQCGAPGSAGCMTRRRFMPSWMRAFFVTSVLYRRTNSLSSQFCVCGSEHSSICMVLHPAVCSSRWRALAAVPDRPPHADGLILARSASTRWIQEPGYVPHSRKKQGDPNRLASCENVYRHF